MNAYERRSRVKAILDTLRNAEGQLQTLKTLGNNGEPPQAVALRNTLTDSLTQTITEAEAWDAYELDKLS